VPQPRGGTTISALKKPAHPTSAPPGKVEVIEFFWYASPRLILRGRLVKDGVRKALQERQEVLRDLVQAIREYRKLSDQPLTLRGSEYAHSVLELNKAIERADNLIQA
jgi:hypothetical protein